MKKTFLAIASCLLALHATNSLAARTKADIKVMTQNQYLGADLGPIVSATTPEDYAVAITTVLQSIAANNFPERAQALAQSISDRQPHLVALQEVYAFGCIDPGTGACAIFDGAFNDHLELTLAALGAQGSDYYVAAEVQNITLPTPIMESLGIPGLPVFLNADAIPDLFITVIDRDVILARGDIDAAIVNYACGKPSLDGCNFQNVAVANTLAGPISIERGYVAVDVIVGGDEYRFVNTHLEVQFPDPNDPASSGLQAVQATELNFALATQPSGNPQSRLIVAGDINSSPTDPVFGPIHPPYTQFVTGADYVGNHSFQPLTDTWDLRPGKPDGFTCCEAGDLANTQSSHNERIDVILAYPAPATVKANVMDAEESDKTASGLWPSDHASVIAELSY